MLKQRKPMNRGMGFQRNSRKEGPTYTRERHPISLTKATRAATYGGTTAEAIDKERPVRSEAYRRLVAAMPCWLCGIEGYSQAAHADQGKGLSIKSDDRTCYPACGPHGTEMGCHYHVGSTGKHTREQRRAMEELAGRETRQRIWNSGLWPKNLPRWTA